VFLVYLVIVSIDTAGPAVPIDRLREALHASASGADGMRHAYLEVGDGRATFSLYLQAPDEACAVRRADHLCRRTMASVMAAESWSVQSARIGL
jgi:hypothetical protein